MNDLSVLDCTLRDGGYINDWNFEKNNIKFIIEKLINSNVDYIEVGYFTECKETNENKTMFNNLKALNDCLNEKAKFLVMINYSEVNIENIPTAKDVPNIYGIRLAFHKKDQVNALEYCLQLKKKGYRVFMQPMVTMTYTKEELKNLIEKVNELNPYAMYFVDSFGTMVEEDVIDRFNFVDELLEKNIILGFHSHNNLQLSYPNVLSFINLNLKRKILIDSSVYGIGRGAGNLNTELIMEYLNKKHNKEYKIDFLLEIIDEYLLKLKSQKEWGYNIEYYLSAVIKCHPNYSKYFMNKQNVSICELKDLLDLIEDDKKVYFNKDYAEKVYVNYMKKRTV